MSITLTPEVLPWLQSEEGAPPAASPAEAVAADPAKQEPDAMYTREEI